MLLQKTIVVHRDGISGKDRPLREDDIMAEWDTEDIVQQAKKMAKLKHKIHAKAKLSIDTAQENDKMYYDKKHADPKVCTSQLLVCVCVVDALPINYFVVTVCRSSLQEHLCC